MLHYLKQGPIIVKIKQKTGKGCTELSNIRLTKNTWFVIWQHIRLVFLTGIFNLFQFAPLYLIVNWRWNPLCCTNWNLYSIKENLFWDGKIYTVAHQKSGRSPKFLSITFRGITGGCSRLFSSVFVQQNCTESCTLSNLSLDGKYQTNRYAVKSFKSRKFQPV